MLKAIDRYIFLQLAITAAFVTLSLTFAVWLTQSLRFFDFIVNRGLPADKFLAFAALLMPQFVGIVLPIASFVAVLFVYNKLLMDRELVVLRATGFGPFQVARPALLLGVVSVLLGYGISLYFLPASFRAFKDLQWEIRNDYSTVLLQEGVFTEVQKGIVVYVRARSESGELLDILVQDSSEADRPPVTMMAKRGTLVRGELGPAVVMLEGNRQEFDGKNLSLLEFDRYTLELGGLAERGGPGLRWREPKERFLHELFGASRTPADRRNRRELRAEGHQRIIAPLYALVFISIGLLALLAGSFSRRGQGGRMLAAIFLVGLIEAGQISLQNLAIKYAALVPVMYIGALLPLALSLYLLAKLDGPRRPRRRAEAAEAAA